jgi:hypothetical protein
MKQGCQVCTHPKRLEIDKMLLSGHSRSSISRLWGLSYNALYNHAHNHLTRQLATHMESVQLKSNIDLLSVIDDTLSKTEIIFKRNFEAGRDLTALKALDGTRATIQLLSGISSQLHQAKMMELDREREEQERQEKKALAFQDELSILSFDELAVLERLHNKIKHRNQDVIIKDGRVTPHWLNPERYEQ